MARSAGNNTFYETEQDAIEQATRYCQDGGSSKDYIIYKAVKRVRSAQPPVVVEDLNDWTTDRQYDD